MVLALVYSIFGMRPFGVIVLQIVLDTLGCWLVLRGLRDEFGTRGSALGGWLYAVNPLLITYTGHVLSESLFVFLLTAALYLLLRLRANAPAWQAFLLGLVVGLGVSVRASLLYLAPVLGLVLLTLHRSWAQRGHAVGLYLLVAGVRDWHMEGLQLRSLRLHPANTVGRDSPIAYGSIHSGWDASRTFGSACPATRSSVPAHAGRRSRSEPSDF
jgi:hypothetical protein